ncbi:MAG: SRPBCC family protein [Anaerolineales bacterium]
MYSFEKSIFINLPQQEVFDYITDPANDKNWRKSSISAEWTSEGPVGVGSTQHSVDKFMGRNMESDSEVTVWDPPNEFGWKSIGGPVPYELSLKLAPDGEGTQLSFSGQAEIAGFFKLAEGLAGKQMEKQIDGDFNNLKKVLESG